MKLIIKPLAKAVAKVTRNELSGIENDSSILVGIEYELIMNPGELGDGYASEAYRDLEDAQVAVQEFTEELIEWFDEAIKQKEAWFQEVKKAASKELSNLKDLREKMSNDMFPETLEDELASIEDAEVELGELLEAESRDDLFNGAMYNFGYPKEYVDLVKRLEGIDGNKEQFLLVEPLEDCEDYISGNVTSYPSSNNGYDTYMGSSIEDQIPESDAVKLVAENDTNSSTDAKWLAEILMDSIDHPPEDVDIDSIDIDNSDLLKERDWSDFPFESDYVVGYYHEGAKRPDSWRVETDTSLSEGGVEIISPAYPMPEALKYLEEMLEHITFVGSTDSSTGLHINMSIEGKSFTNDFDPLKLALFVDEGYVEKFFKGRTDSWFARSINSWIGAAVKGHEDADAAKLRKVLLKAMPAERLMGVNTTHATMDLESSRVEFRYLGGEGYEHKHSHVKLQILKFALYMKLAFDRNYRRREYLSKLIRLRNKFGESGQDIAEVGTLVKETPKLWVYDVKGKKIIVNREAPRSRRRIR
jgi:hypothetical protein